ncbi:MAG: hypothetical protein IPO07_09760 [Haliscomenobacter sp.]|nr:hypothetical protein [Haliscomenobacter sp.]MBK9489046.1 hypothetical protein [Haliscomenobacter sp.]
MPWQHPGQHHHIDNTPQRESAWKLAPTRCRITDHQGQPGPKPGSHNRGTATDEAFLFQLT